ncbi:uncharacterized protein LOC132714137 isoform X2 [Ruditapes philippinarum]|uniref:uncharacterized protein LOC132714137 isoform X2 n=1 Tax=Ruditapes philippinarum TaxID=129788 RepID=UPI00295B7842|nr:uncharacterized protein LOC132714137 isoform X2 [Ruditapes philippinarum]
MKDSRQSEGSSLMLVLLVMVYIKLYYLVNTNPLKLWHASPIKKRRAKRSPTEQKCCMSKSFEIRGLSISECECIIDGTANEHRTREQFQLDVSLQENESSQLVLHLLVGSCTERGLEGRLFLLDVESIEYVNDLDDESCLGPSAEEISEQCTASVMKPHDCATDMSYKIHEQCSQQYMSDSRLGGIISHSDEYLSIL